MRAIAQLAMKGPVAASLSAAVYAVLALIFAPFLVVSAAIVCLSVLRHGQTQGARVAGFALSGAGLAYYLALGTFSWAIFLAVAILPLIPVAGILRRSGNQAYAFVCAAAFGLVYAVAVRLSVGDVDAFWAARLALLSEAISTQGGRLFSAEEMGLISGVMHSATITIVIMYVVFSVLLGRWWQAVLYNPGGFGKEFQTFTLPRIIMPVAAAVGVVCLFLLVGARQAGIAGDFLLVLMVLFAIQGAAAIHFRVAQLKLSKAWLAGLYAFLILVPQFVGLIFSFIGIVDSVVDFRRLRANRS